MNGASGHAGLFSTAHDLTVLAQFMLNGGIFQDKQLFNQSIIDMVTTPIPNPQDETDCQFGTGWKLNVDPNENNYIFGDSASSKTFGHDG
jgi:N-acetylmuramoyl-L-alanine amidase